MDVDGKERFLLDGEEAGVLVSVEVPASGLLALDVLKPYGTKVSPQLVFLGADCAATSDAGGPVVRLHELIGGALIHVRSAGTYYFRAGEQDPSRSFGDLWVRTGFAADDVGEADGPVLKDGETGGGSGGSGGGSTGGGDENPVDEILPIVGGVPSPDLAANLASICRAQLADDFGDTFSCASVLNPGARVAGTIGNDWGDDADVFVLTLARRTTLDIELSGAGIEAAVYDRSGQAMALSGEAPFGAVRAFAPGRYYLVIAGTRVSESEYTLSLEEIRR